MALSIEQQILIESRVTNEGKSIVLAYLFWFFLGFFSAHRFYLGSGLAILQLLLNFLVIGLIWTLIDLFLIPGMVRKSRVELRHQFAAQLRPSASGAPRPTSNDTV